MANERRDGPRLDLRLRVRYSGTASGGAIDGEAEASDVSPKGLRLESEHAVVAGSDLQLVVDIGTDAEELVVTGNVTWCRERPSPTGKPMYDVGVRFESDWLSRDRGPLGLALARIFAMNSYEPAREEIRTHTQLMASAGPVDLTIGNVSIGGMQLKAATTLPDGVKTGRSTVVVIHMDADTHTLQGRIAWVAGQGDRLASSPRIDDSFGIEFGDVKSDDRALLERIRTGQVVPTTVTIRLDS
jgi:PilZ domain